MASEEAIFDGERVTLHEAELQDYASSGTQMIGHSGHGKVRVTRYQGPLGTVTYTGTIGKRHVTGRPTATTSYTHPAHRPVASHHSSSAGGGGGAPFGRRPTDGGPFYLLFGWAVVPLVALLSFAAVAYIPMLALFGLAHAPVPIALLGYAAAGPIALYGALRMIADGNLGRYRLAAWSGGVVLLIGLVMLVTFQPDGTSAAGISVLGTIITTVTYVAAYCTIDARGGLRSDREAAERA